MVQPVSFVASVIVSRNSTGAFSETDTFSDTVTAGSSCGGSTS